MLKSKINAYHRIIASWSFVIAQTFKKQIFERLRAASDLQNVHFNYEYYNSQKAFINRENHTLDTAVANIQ